MKFEVSDSDSDDDGILRTRVRDTVSKNAGVHAPKKNAAFTWLAEAIAEADDGDDAAGVIAGTYRIENGELEHEDDEQGFDGGMDGGPSDDMFDAMLVSQAPEEDQAFFDDLVERMAQSKIVDTAPKDGSGDKTSLEFNDEMSFFDMMAAAKGK